VTPRVRLFADRDYTAFVRIRRLAEQRDISVALAREQDGHWDHSRYERIRVVAADEEDAPLGYGEIYHEPSRFDPRRYFVRLAVDPRLRRRGIGAAIWTELRAELEERTAKIACLWTDDGTACREFIVRRGFIEVVRSYEQVLALATAPHQLAGAEEAVMAGGIRVETLSELRARVGDEALGRVHELYTASRVDQPSLGKVTARPFEDWRREVFDELKAPPDAYFVASAGDQLVGCSAVHPSAEDVLRILITGVLPEYRRRGIARLLKLRVHGWARAHGYREIHTSTSNAAAVDLNTALGYAIVGSWAGYELAIR
jgi:ribosomal protein S18 acetylase RimI-like enzyme